MCWISVTRKWNSGYDNAKWLARSHNDNGVAETMVKEWYKKGWQYPAISQRSFSGRESNFSNAGRQTWHTRWHFAMPHRMADFSLFFALWEISVRSYCGRLEKEGANLRYHIGHPAHPSQLPLFFLRRWDRDTFEGSSLVCGRTYQKSYERDTCQINHKQFVLENKSGIESIEPCGNTAGSGTWRYWQLNSINCF